MTDYYKLKKMLEEAKIPFTIISDGEIQIHTDGPYDPEFVFGSVGQLLNVEVPL